MPWPFTQFEIAETSMSPALQPGDYVLARRGRPAVTGSVVVFRSEVGHTVKRVVAVGPATVSVEAGVVLVDGSPIDDRWSGATRPDGSWVLPTGTIFVLGDNRHQSDGDSRALGPIPADEIEGVVVFRYWPLRLR